MTDPADERTPVVPLLLLLVLLLVVLEHVRAYFGPASFEHFSDFVRQLTAGQGSRSLLDERGLVTGGGGLVFGLHWLVWKLGLPYPAMHALYGALDIGAVLAWILLARRWLPAPMLWSSALVLALYGVPKLFLIENSTLMAFIAPPLLACLVVAVRRDSMAWMAAAGVLLALSTHLGLLALFALPAVLAGIWWSGFTRRLVASVLLIAAGILPVLPIWGGAQGDNPLVVEQLIRLAPTHIVHTVTGVVGYLVSYLISPLLLLGLVAVLVAGRDLRRRAPYLGWGLAWLAATAIPAAILDQFEEPYHFAMASPGRATVAGFGVFACCTLLRRVLGERLSWTGLLAGMLALACGVSFTLTCWAATHTDPDELTESPPPCASWDQGCRRIPTTRLLERLDEAGVLPAPDRSVAFHGVSSGCLEAAWAWRQSQLAPDPHAAGPGTHHVLLMPSTEGVDAADLTGAVEVEDQVAIAGVRPVEWDGDWDAQPMPPHRLVLPDVGQERIYIGLETSRMFIAGEVSQQRDGSSAQPVARCDNDRLDGWIEQYDGFFLLDAALTPGEGPLIVDIDSDLLFSVPPERVDVLLLPSGASP